MEATSVGGTVHFDGKSVTIRREGRLAVSVFGRGEHTIPVGRISSVDWKPATLFSSGHLRFAVPGSQASAEATPVNRDENAVLFSRKDQPAFEKLRDLVRDALSQ
jgi:hypothetical protein